MTDPGKGSMPPAVIGWESENSIPDHSFNDFLSSRKGRLYLEDLDLAGLFLGDHPEHGFGRVFTSPLEIVYLPKIRQKIASLRNIFQDVIRDTGYGGRFLYTYPSKANAAEEVVRTILEAGVDYEISSSVDVDIVGQMISRGCLKPEQSIICNGFKVPHMTYTERIIQLQIQRGNVIPVIEDLSEIQPLIDSGLHFDVGLRQKSYGHHTTLSEMDAANSRFGMQSSDIWRAAEIIAAAPTLQLKMYHAMVGSQIAAEGDFVGRLGAAIEIYAQLRQCYPSLSIFNFGGGVPVPMTLNFSFDIPAFVNRLLVTLQSVCGRYKVPVPDVMGEFGRYTVAEHGAHCFKVLTVKENGSDFPWYIIDGSIMTSFPDTWALGEHFVVLPLTHLDKRFRRVQLGGITCDSDDIYPPKDSLSPLYLPEETTDLYIGFFNIGAYQEMLGGVGGTKHCVIPEANELIIDRDPFGRYRPILLPGQTVENVMNNLGYRQKAAS